MKVSIASVFDHINTDWRKINIANLVSKFNQTTAEIERWYPITIDLKNLTLVHVTSIGKQCKAHSPELKKTIMLSLRPDAKRHDWYFATKKGKEYHWATSLDLGGEKEMLLPALRVSSSDQKGGWKKSFETKDFILEVDNKSITHRPDLWGYRGFAREIAAILDKKLKPFEQFLAKKTVKPFASKAAKAKTFPFTIGIEDPKRTKRFSGFYIPEIAHTPSLLWMVARLSRVDARSIDALIDMTNYVMLDTSQPMHVFDADK